MSIVATSRNDRSLSSRALGLQMVVLSIYIYTYAYIYKYLYTHIHWNKPVHRCHQSQREEPQQQSTWLAGRRVVYVYTCMHVYVNIYTLKQTRPSWPPVATREASASVHMACSLWPMHIYVCIYIKIFKYIHTLKQTCPSLPPVATRGASAAVHMACRWSWCPERLNTHCELSPSLLPHDTYIRVMSQSLMSHGAQRDSIHMVNSRRPCSHVTRHTYVGVMSHI